MAADEVNRGTRIMITGIDADWTSSKELNIAGYMFSPGNTGDGVVLKEDTDAGKVFLRIFNTGLEAAVVIFPHTIVVTPMIDFSDCTLNTGHHLTLFVR